MANELVQVQPAGNGTVARQEFGAQQLTQVAETAITAAAAQAKAAVEARYVMALQRPRDWEVVRDRFLKECSRPSLAEIAIYHKPIGKGVEGPSIRLAEVALRCMGNVLIRTPAVYDDAEKRIVRVEVTDLESNSTYDKDVTILKVVERTTIADGQTPLSVRTNSRGQKTYTVAATDEDLLNKENALISKALRTQALRVFPGDILEEGLRTVRDVRASKVKEDPDAAKRKVIDAFAVDLGVPAAQLSEYLGHPLDVITPTEVLELRSVYQGIKDGEAQWAEVIESKKAQRGQGTAPPPTEAPRGFKDKVKAKASASAPPPAAGQPDREVGADDDR